MNAKRIRPITGVLFALSSGLALGLALSVWVGIASARNVPHSPGTLLHTPHSPRIYSIEASVPLTTPTPLYTQTRTPTPSITPPPNCPDLIASIYWVMQCYRGDDLALLVRQTNPQASPVPPTTMRLQNRLGDYQDIPVPELNPQNNFTYSYSCYYGGCTIGYAMPMTLTVDYFNQVAECNEDNNTATINYVPPTHTPCPTYTYTATYTRTLTPTPTGASTPCTIPFSDVHPSDYFYEPVRYLYCHGVISGYADGTFRPSNFITKAQMTKILVLAFDIPIYVPPRQYYYDVPPEHPFYVYIESYTYYMGCPGYECNYFLPNLNMTRGSLCRYMVLVASRRAGWQLVNPYNPTFSDVPRDHVYYQYIETAFCHGAISGYSDGTFRPSNNVTRGQLSKIVYRAVNSGTSCTTPTPTAGLGP